MLAQRLALSGRPVSPPHHRPALANVGHKSSYASLSHDEKTYSHTMLQVGAAPKPASMVATDEKKRPATSTGQHLPCIANNKAPLTELDPPTKEHAVRLCQCHHELQSRLLLFMGGRPEPLSTRPRSTACSDNGPSSLSDAPQPTPLPAPTAPPSTTFHLPKE